MNNAEQIAALRVEGLPMLSGKLGFEGRQRAVDLEQVEPERLAYALAEREEQLALVIRRLQESAQQ